MLSSSHGWMWKLDHKQDWALKNWCFQIVVLEKILEIPLGSKEMKPVNPKGNQPWIFIGRTDAEAARFTGKDTDVGKDWAPEEKETEDKMIRWPHWLNKTWGLHKHGYSEGYGSLVCCSSWGGRESDRTEWRNNRLPIFGYKLGFLTCRSAPMLSLLNHSWGNSAVKQ